MYDRRWERISAASGIVFFLMIPVLFLLATDQPSFGASATEVQQYQLDEQEQIRLYLTLFTLTTFFLIWFLGTLVGILRAAEGGAGHLSTIALAGAVIGVVALLLTIMFEAAAAFRPEETSAEMTRLLWELHFLSLPVLGIGFAVFLAATAIAIVRTDVLPSWFGWLALVPAVLSAIDVGQIWKNDGHFLGSPWWFPAFIVWTLVASVVLSLRLRSERPAAQAPAATRGSA